MTILGIDTVAVVVADRVKAIRWYRDSLGLEIAYIGPPEPSGDPSLQGTPENPGHWIELGPRRPRTRVHLCELDGAAEPGPTGITFLTDDIEGDYRRMKARGVRFSYPPRRMEWGEWLCAFEDPDGNRFDLKQPRGGRARGSRTGGHGPPGHPVPGPRLVHLGEAGPGVGPGGMEWEHGIIEGPNHGKAGRGSREAWYGPATRQSPSHPQPLIGGPPSAADGAGETPLVRPRGSWAGVMLLQLTLVALIVALPVLLPESTLYVFAIAIPLGFLVPLLWWRRQVRGTGRGGGRR